MDRSDIRLPGVTKAKQKNENAIIVGANEFDLKTNQEESIQKMCRSNKKSAVILLNGSPIDMSAWIETCPAIIEAWYPGEQGAQAITEIIFGQTNPSGKLPITFPRSVGQLPLFYSMKPSGRGYGYVDNDGSPLYPFGYGLSYTSFEFDKFSLNNADNSLKISFSAKNTGDFDGEEVIQIYFSGRNCDVVMPLKELKAYKRFRLNKEESLDITVEIPDDAFFYYDRQLKYGMHNGDYTISFGTSSTDIKKNFEVRIRNGLILTDE
jgi:beta-glucosidase